MNVDYEPAGIVHPGEYYFPPDTAPEVARQWAAMQTAASASGEQIQAMARILQEQYENALDRSGPITYTNRAARRARAKNERKRV